MGFRHVFFLGSETVSQGRQSNQQAPPSNMEENSAFSPVVELGPPVERLEVRAPTFFSFVCCSRVPNPPNQKRGVRSGTNCRGTKRCKLASRNRPETAKDEGPGDRFGELHGLHPTGRGSGQGPISDPPLKVELVGEIRKLPRNTKKLKG